MKLYNLKGKNESGKVETLNEKPLTSSSLNKLIREVTLAGSHTNLKVDNHLVN